MKYRFSCSMLLWLMLFGAGCANIVAPAGGAKDVLPPRLVSVSPADSQRNVRTGKVRFDFDEYIVLNDAGNQVLISPILPVPPVVSSLYKHVTVAFPDSLLEANTTYHISLGNAVRDNHEGNIYKGRDFIFSTGTYFDSLKLSGRVVNAVTGAPDTAATIVLYKAADGDSALLRHKPLYALHADAAGRFAFTGLPQRSFRCYALQDKNSNLIFDAGEWVGFTGAAITPGVDSGELLFRTFPPEADSAGKANAPDVTTRPGRERNIGATGYAVLADTSDLKRRSQDITRPLGIAFAKLPSVISREKIFLSYDSAGITVEAPLHTKFDSAALRLDLNTPWLQNTAYTLRLQKGFAKDSTGTDLLPGRFSFRTRRDEDYATLKIHLPTKYFGTDYVLRVSSETDTIYQQPILDSTVFLPRLAPGSYRLLVIGDRNHNGRWDTGDFFGGRQPETVYPYDQVIMLKPGWENEVDFEREERRGGKSPEKSPAPAVK